MLLTPAMRKYSDQGVPGWKNPRSTRLYRGGRAAKIEALIHENPSYFYDVLPFAYALGLTDTFAKQFESIAVEPPNWYYGHYSTFNTVVFIGALNRSMNQMNTAMISTPNSGGHGGSFSGGGGGFSGGGVGGGGGGGW